jgi:arabinogalactan endo-1,4-beta-galactosidase
MVFVSLQRLQAFLIFFTLPLSCAHAAPEGLFRASHDRAVFAGQTFAFLRGADLSEFDQLSDHGAPWADSNGRTANLLQLMKSRGINTIRLRAWVDPGDGYCGSERTIAVGREVKAAGLKLLLDLHYSDTWADPGRQTKPVAWETLAGADLERHVFLYTRDLVAQMTAQGARPDIVQIGNEISGGMLWDDGRIDDGGETSASWDRFARLVGAGIDGARAAGATSIMVHHDQGASHERCRHFFASLLARNVDFEIIGLSYYPWWHGSMEALTDNLERLAADFGKPLIVVETAYPWTLAWQDATHNPVGRVAQLLPDHPATPEGQAAFVRRLIERVESTPGGLGAGVFYWGAAAISRPTLGSSWENMTLFDFQGRELPGLRALGGVEDSTTR